MPVSSLLSGSPRSGSRWSSASAARTFRLVSGGSRRTISAVAGSSTTRRLGTTCGDLLSEEVAQLVGAARAAIERASVPKDFRVEVWVGHDLERRVQAHGLFMAHQDRGRATALGDGHALVAASDIINEPAELRLRLGKRKRLHDLTSLLTNRRFGKVGGSRGPGPRWNRSRPPGMVI